MASLKQYQVAADKVRQKLGLADVILVRWLDKPCRARRDVVAHCHVQDDLRTQLPRGTICVRRGVKWAAGAYDIMSHEVAHLVAKTHGSKKMLAAIATANPRGREAVMARRVGAIPHRHTWIATRLLSSSPGKARMFEECRACLTSRQSDYVRVKAI